MLAARNPTAPTVYFILSAFKPSMRSRAPRLADPPPSAHKLYLCGEVCQIRISFLTGSRKAAPCGDRTRQNLGRVTNNVTHRGHMFDRLRRISYLKLLAIPSNIR
jgi:hypothetical protein